MKPMDRVAAPVLSAPAPPCQTPLQQLPEGLAGSKLPGQKARVKITATSSPSPSHTGCCLSVNKVFNMQKRSLASPGFSGGVSAAGLTGHVTGNLYTQLLITDKWVDMLSLPAPGASCQASPASPPEEPVAALGLPAPRGSPGSRDGVGAGGGGHLGGQTGTRQRQRRSPGAVGLLRRGGGGGSPILAFKAGVLGRVGQTLVSRWGDMDGAPSPSPAASQTLLQGV